MIPFIVLSPRSVVCYYYYYASFCMITNFDRWFFFIFYWFDFFFLISCYMHNRILFNTTWVYVIYQVLYWIVCQVGHNLINYTGKGYVSISRRNQYCFWVFRVFTQALDWRIRRVFCSIAYCYDTDSTH